MHMVNERRVPAGPQPVDLSPTKRDWDSTTKSASIEPSLVENPVPEAPMLSASASHNQPLFPWRGGKGDSQDLGDSTGSYDFLPSVSFDDLQSSLETASTDFKLTQFPSPTGHGSILEPQAMLSDKTADQTGVAHNGDAAQTTQAGMPPPPPTATRPARSGSILRRPSTSSRQPSISSTGSGPSGILNAPTAPAAMRNRRQSHYPPVSHTTNIARPPRKSIGPGTVDADFASRPGQKRRPSLRSSRGPDARPDSTRTSTDGTTGLSFDTTRSFANMRAAKARSIGQPLARTESGGLTMDGVLAPDRNRLSTAVPPRSPAAGRGEAPAPGSAQSTASQKRASALPGSAHQSHATGLGARTISPTDTRRMKRMSMHQPQSLNLVANIHVPPPPPFEPRENSRSPSMIPRKASATPSSSRTTPDINRKSYSSGLSVGSANSSNTVRTSTGSIQPRIPQSASTSRLPAPKPQPPLSHNNNAVNEDDEDVPPVPAIPKAYESPKEPAADVTFSDKRRINLAAADASSLHSNSTSSFSASAGPEPAGKARRKASTRKSTTAAVLQADKKGHGSHVKKHSGGLHLPPITVGPLNASTAAKVAALQDSGQPDRNLTPPPSRVLAKTPSTPLTASKSMFFSRHRHRDVADAPNRRSSSTVNNRRLDASSGVDGTSSSESLVGPPMKTGRKPSISPYLSSSVPKSGSEDHGFILGHKPDADVGNVTEPILEPKPSQKPSGPRAQRTARHKPKSPPLASDPEEPSTPSSMSSIRRKLSLSWKRGTSKNSTTHANDTSDGQTDPGAKQESMPPPRMPVSATVGNLDALDGPSPSSSLNSTGKYLESRRRKSSASSLNAFSHHDRNKSENWTQFGSTGRKASNDSTGERVNAARNPSVMHKILKPKVSAAAIAPHDPWTAGLDREDLVAEEEIKKIGSRRKETEIAAKTLDTLRKRATPKERVGSQEAVRIAMLNIYERGEIVDYNDVYFCGTQNAKKIVGDLQSDSPNFGYDDERGDYTIVPGDHLAYRYEIIDILGKGSFGQVVRCIDHKMGVLVAVKIIRNKKRFHQQALVEVNILQKLREWDPKNKHSMVNFTHSFYFRGHLCISTELLDMNLYEFIKVNSFRGFSLKLIRRFTKQMLSSLNLLKQHKVIHCDLKPENILLRHPLHTEIKTIDFGSSCFETEKVYTYIQSRFYRSPEVILGMTYGMPIDMWSLGCILAELYTGVPIFPGENEQEQLACIMEVFGPPEKHLIEKSTRKKLFFDSMGKPRLTVSSKGRRRRPSSKTLQQALKCDDDPFLDFLTKCLRWDPDRRLKPEDAMHHEFITGRKASAPLPRIPNRDSSPAKRYTTTAAPRPLPEPPGLGIKGGPTLRPRESTAVSPHKPVSGATRRTSGANAALPSAATKRTSTGTAGVSAGTSSLPRAAGRSASARQDLASAGAAAAMNRRA